MFNLYIPLSFTLQVYCFQQLLIRKVVALKLGYSLSQPVSFSGMLSEFFFFFNATFSLHELPYMVKRKNIPMPMTLQLALQLPKVSPSWEFSSKPPLDFLHIFEYLYVCCGSILITN